MIWRYTLSGFIFGGCVIAIKIAFESYPTTNLFGWVLPFLLAGLTGFIIGVVKYLRHHREQER